MVQSEKRAAARRSRPLLTPKLRQAQTSVSKSPIARPPIRVTFQSTCMTKLNHGLTEGCEASDGCRLHTRSCECRNPKGMPWVLFVHGFAADSAEGGLFTECMGTLSASGVSATAYDWRGLGRSQGNFCQSTLAQHSSDLAQLLEIVSSRALSVGASGVHMVGFSLGCALIANVLRVQPKVSSLVYLSPALRPRASMWPRYDTLPHRDQLRRRGYFVKPGTMVKIGSRMSTDLARTDLTESAFDPGVPVLVCHGTSDARIPFSESTRLVRMNPTARIRFVQFEGASHSFRPESTYRPRLHKLIAEWVCADHKTLRARKSGVGPARGQGERVLLPT